MKGAAEGESWDPLTLGLARNADALLLVIDLSRDPCVQMQTIENELERAGMSIRQLESDVTIMRTAGGSGIQVFLSEYLVDGVADDVRKIEGIWTEQCFCYSKRQSETG